MSHRYSKTGRSSGAGNWRGCGIQIRGAPFVLAVVFSSMLPVPSQGQHQHPRHKQDSKRQVEKLEETWRLAQLNGDAEAMDRLLSDDYIGITMSGQIVTKTQQLDRMGTRTLSLSKIDIDDVKVKLIGQTAVVTSRADVEGTNDGQSMHGIYRYTRVYTRTPSGTWKITNFEATRVGAPGAQRQARSFDQSAPVPLQPGGGPPAVQKLVAGR
jgi:ketosteroid isomerase-like protein